MFEMFCRDLVAQAEATLRAEYESCFGAVDPLGPHEAWATASVLSSYGL